MRGRTRGTVAVALGLVAGSALSASARGPSAFRAQTFPGVHCSTTLPAAGAGTGLGPLELPFQLDQGRLAISSAGRQSAPAVSAELARFEFLSTAEIAGPHRCVGFGLASVSTRPTTVGPASPLRLAWVGVVAGTLVHCPIITVDTVEQQPQPLQVIIIDGADPHSVSVYTSRGSYCGQPLVGPSIAPAHQVVSVPFELVNLEIIAYDMPACGARIQDVDQSGSQTTHDLTVWVHVSVPFDSRGCAAPRHVVEDWGVTNDVAPLAAHAPTGPVAALNR